MKETGQYVKTPSVGRLAWVDSARGLALWAMAAFHLTWDLAHFGWINPETPYRPAFHWLGHAIAASFLLLVGVSLVLARRARGPLLCSRAFWRRWAMIAAAAAAISAMSFWLFPQAPIFFGILHCIALASIIAAPFAGLPAGWALAAGALALLAPMMISAPFFDAPIFQWIGLGTFEPPSNDFRPLLPWVAFVLFGVGLASLLPVGRLTERPSKDGLWQKAAPQTPGEEAGAPAILAEATPAAFHTYSLSEPKPAVADFGIGTAQAGSAGFGRSERGKSGVLPSALAFCGRHSLAFYLIHQPILFGFFSLLALFAVSPAHEALFIGQCVSQCVGETLEPDACQRTCVCTVDRAKARGVWPAMARDALSPDQKRQTHDDIMACFAASKIR